MTESNIHDLEDFMRAITEEMAREYDRIQKRAVEDPGTAGDQGEENWATLLREWLPPAYQIVTKGRILSKEGIASPQVDVLILHPAYPRQLLDKKLYLAGGVIAVFECKITLKSEHIHSTVERGVEIRRHTRIRSGSPYKELYSPIIYGLLAHSHIWKGKNSTPIENIHKHLLAADHNFVKHPREMLDIICVADLATWTCKKSPWSAIPRIGLDLYNQPIGSDSLRTHYTYYSNEPDPQRASFTPIGTMISNLLYKLAWEEPGIRNLALYFTQVLAPRLGRSSGARRWGDDVYSSKVRDRVTSSYITGTDYWDEWSMPLI